MIPPKCATKQTTGTVTNATGDLVVYVLRGLVWRNQQQPSFSRVSISTHTHTHTVEYLLNQRLQVDECSSSIVWNPYTGSEKKSK